MSVVSTISEPVPFVADCSVEDDNSSSCSHSEEGESGYKLAALLSDSEQNQGKDSGVDCGPEIFVVPDEEAAKKIRESVEFYFSDANLLKDAFLLKHIRRNKEGYVSVKLISSFRKIRNLNRNWKAVAYSIQKSEVLALNAEGTKVRRLMPLPDHDETVQSRTVLVYDVPSEKITVESLSETFSKCGDIALVRVLRPGGSVSQDIKRFFAKNPAVQSKDCGLVEFEEFAGAQKALALCCGGEKGPKVVPLLTKDAANRSAQQGSSKTQANSGSPKKDSPKKKKKSKRSFHDSIKNVNVDDSESDAAGVKDQRSRSSSSGSLGYGSSSSSGYLSSSPAESWFLRRHSYHPSGKPAESSSFASLASRNARGSKDRLSKEKMDSEKRGEAVGCHSPWRRRRELLAESSPSLFSSSENIFLAVKTIRLPKGPDGTKGFQLRTRLPLPSTAE